MEQNNDLTLTAAKRVAHLKDYAEAHKEIKEAQKYVEQFSPEQAIFSLLNAIQELTEILANK